MVPMISTSSVPAERENNIVLDSSVFVSSNLISSPSDKMKNSSSISVPIFASKKSRWKVMDTSPPTSDTSVSKIKDIKSRSAVADFKMILFPV